MKPGSQARSYDAPLWSVAVYIAGKIGEAADSAECFPKTRDFTRQKAMSGEITLWGKKQLSNGTSEWTWRFDSCLTEISADYWKANKLNAVAFATKEPREPLNVNVPHTLPVRFDQSKPKGWEDSYADLRINRKQVMKLNPSPLLQQYRRTQPPEKLGTCVVPAGLSDNTSIAVLLDFNVLETAVYQMQSYVGQAKGKVSPKELLRQFKKQCPQELYYAEPYMQTIIEDYKAERRARPGMIAKAMIQDARGLKKSTVETYIKRVRAEK